MVKILLSIFIISSINLFSLELVIIGTGGSGGVYYPTGGNICRIVNKERINNSQLRCIAQTSGGSIDNIHNLRKKEINLAIAQSDVVYQAYNGLGKFTNEPFYKLRTIMTIYTEPLNLIVTKSSNIKQLSNIHDKNISIGQKGDGTNTIVDMLFTQSSNLNESMLNTFHINTNNLSQALKDKKINGFFYTAGHPNSLIKDIANNFDVDIVNITEDNFSPLYDILKLYPYYATTTIPAGTYNKIIGPRYSFGPKATLVTTTDTSDAVVTEFLKTFFAKFEEFKRMHPAYKNLSKENLLEGLGAPLHNAAKQFYIQQGLLNN